MQMKYHFFLRTIHNYKQHQPHHYLHYKYHSFQQKQTLIMVRSLQNQIQNKEEEYNYGKTVISILVTGIIIKYIKKVNMFIQMEITMKVSLRMKKRMDMVCMYIVMAVVNMKVIGKIIYNMDMDMKHGKMERVMKGSIIKDVKVEKEDSNGEMEMNIQECLIIIC